jgi:hypothetical protein
MLIKAPLPVRKEVPGFKSDRAETICDDKAHTFFNFNQSKFKTGFQKIPQILETFLRAERL